MDDLGKRAAEGMRKNGFEVVELHAASDARAYLLAQIKPGMSVGVGGSVSVRELGVLEALEEQGCAVHSHWGAAKEERRAIQNKAREADVYLCSVNAVTRTGKLVLIDGNGNRVGAICDGPEQMYLVVSQNKVVDGGINTAIARIKKNACPQNSRRLGLQTACAQTGNCDTEACGNASICNLTLVVERVPGGRKLTVLLVEEALGY